ncbi:MAG TPA: hypothetical protein VN948_04975 [Terriglobales bacterium]|nr:hypothetical protein [Terriglobales bacterium]
MKHRIMSSFAVLALLLMLSSPSPAAGQHPRLMAAVAALADAKAELRSAPHNFGGHREDAIRAIVEAENQLHICLSY